MKRLAQKLKEYHRCQKTKRERITENVEKEDFLLSQIDEFREKAKQLQNLLSSKENKVQQLQEIVAEREGKAKELSDMIDERQDAADRVVAGVGAQIDSMVLKVDAKLNELNETFAERLAENAVNSTDQSEEVRSLIEEQNQKLTETVEGLNGQFDKIRNDIFEKIHSEDVKCYRNIQTLVDESDKKIEEMIEKFEKVSSLKTMSTIIMIITVLNFAGLAGVIARIFGLI